MKKKETVTLYLWGREAKTIAKALHFALTDSPQAQEWLEKSGDFDAVSSVIDFLEDKTKKCCNLVDYSSRRKVFEKKSPVNKKAVNKKT